MPPFLAAFWKAAVAFPRLERARALSGGRSVLRGLLRGRMVDAPVGFSPRAADGETALLFPQVNFSRSSVGCWAQRTRPEKQLVAVVAVLAAVLGACLLGLVLQYRARESCAVT